MQLTIEKYQVLHGGKNNPGQKYFLLGQYINSCDVLSDLSIMRSTNRNYRQHLNAVITRGRQVTGAILHTFTTRDPKILWPAFITYVKPINMYSASALSPV